MKRLPADVREGLAEDIRLMVAGGFASGDVIARQLADWYPDHLDLVSAKRRTARAIAAHRREQASWPAVTDCDRLDAAFAALDAAGIVARHDFAECKADGHDQIGHELKTAREAGQFPRGYTFYTFDNTDNAVEGGGLHLSFGAAPSGKAADKRIAKQIVAALTAHGLKPEWGGNPVRCVFVPLDWKRRR